MTAKDKRRLSEADAIIEACRPHLHGHSPEAMGAALATLVASWIAGHMVWSSKERRINRQATEAFRDAERRLWSEAVDKLVPIEEAYIMTSPDIRKPWQDQ